jgi:hypothetical protein
MTTARNYGWALLIMGVVIGNFGGDLPRIPAEYDALATYMAAVACSTVGLLILALAAIGDELSKKRSN